MRHRIGCCSYCYRTNQELARSPLDICTRCFDYLGPRYRRDLCSQRCIEAVGLLANGYGDGFRGGTVQMLFRRGWVSEYRALHDGSIRLTASGKKVAVRYGYTVRGRR
ncbi:hypothetical protein LCGC14_1879340 [marine sediment metagenome]|uniref:Uncharacterized protein n=1 Tax=marine sediment metagenome TaxID=412755 RepID=A0A0F9IGS9_9ZZZZ